MSPASMSSSSRSSPKFSGKQKEGVFGAFGSEYEDEDDEDEEEDEEVSDDFMEGYDHKKNRKKKSLDRKRKMDPSMMEPFPELSDFLDSYREQYESVFDASSESWRIKNIWTHLLSFGLRFRIIDGFWTSDGGDDVSRGVARKRLRRYDFVHRVSDS